MVSSTDADDSHVAPPTDDRNVVTPTFNDGLHVAHLTVIVTKLENQVLRAIRSFKCHMI